MPKVSAILPIYGEKVIERSLRSLLEQTLDDIEFILVDDCSPDSAYEIAERILAEEQYAHLKDNIKIIHHQENKGVQAVRRNGWLASTGDYIYQFDSDDWLDRDILRKLWEKAVEGDYDMVECDFYESDAEGNDHNHVYPEPHPYEDWVPWPGIPVHWNKIFRRSVYENDIEWPTEPFIEDYLIVTQLLYYCKSHCYINDILYHYFLNPAGIMLRSKNGEKAVMKTRLIPMIEQFLDSKGVLEKYRDRLAIMKSQAMEEAWDMPRKDFMKVFPKDRFKILTCKYIPLRTRLGHISKMLGIHGISKLFCIIAFFV